MRLKTITLLVMGLALAGCNHTNKPKVLDKGAMLYVNVKEDGTRAVDESGEEVLFTPREIVQNCNNFCFDDKDGLVNALGGISEEMRDLENNRLKMWGEQIINADGTLNDYFMTCRNVRVLDGRLVNPNLKGLKNPPVDYAIVAYIPNKVMKEGWVKIQKAYKEGNCDEVYRLFQEVYTAIHTLHPNMVG